MNTTIRAAALMALTYAASSFAADLYVATSGSDDAAGTAMAPYKTIAKAKAVVRSMIPAATGPINVYIRAGTYYLDSTLTFTSADGGSATVPITYSAFRGEKVIISGGFKVTGTWTATTLNGVSVQTTNIGANKKLDQLFLNGKRQIMARYPNYNAGKSLQGDASSGSVFSKVNSCASPQDGPGYIRTLHPSLWGGDDFIITGKSSGSSQPPWQWVGDNNRSNGFNPSHMMAENIIELLDTAGEWYYKKSTGDLYFYPPTGANLSSATVELATLESLFRVVGTAGAKVKYLTFNRLTFTQAYRTLFSGKFEPLLRGDWSIVRAGAVFIQDAENITIKHCFFDQLGGNGVFMNGYNRNHLIFNNEFIDVGATCVQTVGLQSAVRCPCTSVDGSCPGCSDNTPGPLTTDYPESIVIDNNLMYNLGVFEKQTAGVNISMSHKITVRHNRITVSPRSAINVNDGTWGGHEIAYNDADSCVRETGDHGPFNAWGRDRYWHSSSATVERAALDAIDIIKIHNNRFRSVNLDGYPAIDLDDGSSYYWVYNNLCFENGIKFREGFRRRGYNNIIVVGRQACHAWYGSCFDSIYHNIIVPSTINDYKGNAYDVAAMTISSGNRAYIDYNLFWNNGSAVNYSPTQNAGLDAHSQVADPKFTNPSAGDYSVAAGSPALTLGFVNFPMDSFGRLNVIPDTTQPSNVAVAASGRVKGAGTVRWTMGSKGLAIRYDLFEKAKVSIMLFSVTGKKVARIVDSWEEPGAYEHAVSAKAFGALRLARNMYLVKVCVCDYKETKRLFFAGD